MKKQNIEIGDKGQWKTLVEIINDWRSDNPRIYDEALTIEDKLEMLRKKINELLDND